MQAGRPMEPRSARVCDGAPKRAAETCPRAVFPIPQPTVIVVADNGKILCQIGKILRRAGFVAYFAVDTASALDALASFPCADVLLIDADMPDTDGVVLADMIKTRCPRIEVLYMTTAAGGMETKFGVRHGPTIEKPLRAHQLAAAVSHACERSRLSRA